VYGREKDASLKPVEIPSGHMQYPTQVLMPQISSSGQNITSFGRLQGIRFL